MAVSTTNAVSGPYVANGVTTSFPFTFKALVASELRVTITADGTETEIAPTEYAAVLNGGGNGGSITFGSAPASGYVMIYSDPAFVQEAAFASGQRFSPTAVNDALDLAAVRDQYLLRKVDAALDAVDAGIFGDVRSDLASPAPGKGAGLVGFSHDATYAPGTVGRSLQRLVYVTDPPFNAVADGTTDDAPAFNAALTYLHSIGGGVLFVPRGLYTVFAEIKVPSAVTVMGSGVDVTIVKAHISLAIDQNVFTNAKNDRLERTDYDDGIHISDMTVDANWQERDDDIGPASGQGACIKFSTVRNSSIKRVKAINGILHCVDIAASTYFDDGNINHNAVGPSLDILVEDVIAMNTSWDDGITTHNSGRIVLNRCQSYRDRAAYGEPQYNQHGIEIDEGSWDVTVTDSCSKGWAGGFQAKGHSTTMPAINIIFNRCAAEGCAVAFHIEHVAEVPEGQMPYARNITLRDCRAKNIGATVATPDTRLISVGGYDSVLIDGFEAEDFNEAHIVVTTNSNNVTFKNVHFWTASERSSDALGLVHMNATVAGGKVTIENLTSSVPQPIPMVRASATATILNVNGVIAFGSDPAVPCIWMSRNSQDQVRNIQQTGYVCDIFLNTDSVNLSNFVELQRGYQVLMRGSVASPEGVINGVNGAQFFSYAGTPSLWLKSGTGNAGWKKLTVAA